ncbi:MAG: response regulator [Bacteroidetes bacterium]|nr:response regulator [Bacteroidota bacterium]
MKIKDLNIGTQLRVGHGLILIFVILLGSVAWFQSNSLWKQTDGIYNHPLKVRRAIEVLKTDVLLIHRSMKDIVLADDEIKRQAEVAAIIVNEVQAFRQIDSISKSYLGPHKDIDDIYKAMVYWKPIRQEIINLVQAGEKKKAAKLTTHDGIGGAQVDSILKQINDVSDFALARGDKFYLTALVNKQNLETFLIILLGIILVLSILISLTLVKWIRTPLNEMIEATDDYTKGNLDSRIEYNFNNELGKLAASFNRLAETNKAAIKNSEVVALISNVMLREEDLHSFCHELIRILLETTGSQIGAVYLLNDQKTDFEHYESIGLRVAASAPFSASSYEGEFGLALASRQIQVIRDIPSDTTMLFHVTAGEFKPREIVSIPILSGDEAVAMISLATLNSFSPVAMRIINDIHNTLTARFTGVLAHKKILDFSEKLELQNRELDERAIELTTQGNELTEQNIELEMQKRELDEANRLKSSFLSNMSHELRTPLNSVIALSGVLNRRLRDAIPEEEYNYIEIIERNGKNLLALINDVLDLSRIEAGHEEITASSFSIFELVDEVVTMLDLQAQDKKIGLINKVGQGMNPIQSDYAKCRHILQNIIGNAVKFTEKGKVEVTAMQLDHEIRVSITDTGIGISEQNLPFIFDEFRQADEGSSRKYGGTGLGLTIAKKYANLLQGEICVTSLPDQGSNFTLILPLKLDTDKIGEGVLSYSMEHHVKGARASEIAIPGAGKNILLVEDSEPAIIQLYEILSEQKFNVVIARNGKEAMEQLTQFKPEAIIMDLMMPEVDGFQLLKMIRETEATSKIPVLILTAKHISKEELSFLKGNNVHEFVQKGDVNRTELIARVNEMVSLKHSKTAEVRSMFPRTERSDKPLILVVEDNPDNMRTVKALLHPDYRTVEAHDGVEGVCQALNHKPDLILMDMSLPVMDGFSSFDEIRKSEHLKNIPVVALTASAMKGNREEILEYGFDDYISKPIDEPVLRKVLKHFLHDGDDPGKGTV